MGHTHKTSYSPKWKTLQQERVLVINLRFRFSNQTEGNTMINLNGSHLGAMADVSTETTLPHTLFQTRTRQVTKATWRRLLV